MRFRPAIVIYFKFYRNGDIEKLKAWSFQLRDNYLCTYTNIEAICLEQCIFLYTPYITTYTACNSLEM